MYTVGTAVRHIVFPRAHGDVDRRLGVSAVNVTSDICEDTIVSCDSEIFFASPWTPVHTYSCPPTSDINSCIRNGVASRATEAPYGLEFASGSVSRLRGLLVATVQEYDEEMDTMSRACHLLGVLAGMLIVDSDTMSLMLSAIAAELHQTWQQGHSRLRPPCACLGRFVGASTTEYTHGAYDTQEHLHAARHRIQMMDSMSLHCDAVAVRPFVPDAR